VLMLSRIVFVEVCICTFIVARYPIFFTYMSFSMV